MSTTCAVSKSSAAHSPYQHLSILPGAKAFCLSGVVTRLPIFMMSLGVVLVLNRLYNNWTITGTMSAACVLAMNCVTPFYTRAFDRFDQARMDWLTLAVQIVTMLAFALATLVHMPIPLLFALAIITGLTQFSLGVLAQTRWSYVLCDVEDDEWPLNTAYVMETTVDEVVFILGPILMTQLATSVHPVSQLFVPTVACGIGGTIFFSLRSIQPPAIVEQVSVIAHDDGSPVVSEDTDQLALHQLKHSSAEPKSVLLYTGVLPLLAVFIVLDISFTSFGVSITATIKFMGPESFLGLQLATLAVGSCIGALVFGSCQLRGSHQTHMMIFPSLLTVGYVFFRLSADNLTLPGAFEILADLTVSSAFATGNLIAEDLVPTGSLTEGLSWVTITGTIGTSAGSSAVGIMLGASNPYVGVTLPFIFTLASVSLTLAGWVSAKRRGWNGIGLCPMGGWQLRWGPFLSPLRVQLERS